MSFVRRAESPRVQSVLLSSGRYAVTSVFETIEDDSPGREMRRLSCHPDLNIGLTSL